MLGKALGGVGSMFPPERLPNQAQAALFAGDAGARSAIRRSMPSGAQNKGTFSSSEARHACTTTQYISPIGVGVRKQHPTRESRRAAGVAIKRRCFHGLCNHHRRSTKTLITVSFPNLGDRQTGSSRFGASIFRASARPTSIVICPPPGSERAGMFLIGIASSGVPGHAHRIRVQT